MSQHLPLPPDIAQVAMSQAGPSCASQTNALTFLDGAHKAPTDSFPSLKEVASSAFGIFEAVKV